MRELVEIGAMFEACLAAFGQVDIVVKWCGHLQAAVELALVAAGLSARWRPG